MRSLSTKAFLIAGVAVALVLAFVVSPLASSKPDGLEKVAADQGIDVGVGAHAAAQGPLADYAVKGVDDTNLSTGLAGVVGVVVTLAIVVGLCCLLRAVRRSRETSATVT